MRRFLRENRLHILIILLVVTAQFFIKDLWAGYYRWHMRPQLIEEGFHPCAGYKAGMSKAKPSNCDLVKVEQSRGRIDEWYVTVDGTEKRHVASFSEHPADNTFAWTPLDDVFLHLIPVIALSVLGFSMWHRMLRTGNFSPLLFMKEAPDRTENVLNAYAYFILIASILFEFMGR